MKKYLTDKIKKGLKWRKPPTKIIVVFGVIIFLLLSFFCFQYLSKLITAKKIEEEKHFNYRRKVILTNFAVSINQKMQTLKNSQDDYEGIGIAFSLNSNIIFISEVINNSPADKSGLKNYDKILKINDKYVLDMTAEDITDALKGEKGTEVKLNIYRKSFDNNFEDFIITRDLIDNSERRVYLAFLSEGTGGETLGDNYIKYKNEIYYWSEGGQSMPAMIPLDIDKDEIETFNGGCEWDYEEDKFDPCDHFAKDNQKVYYNWFEIKGADPETFELIEKGNRVNFSKDKNSVFYENTRLKNADPETFITLSSEYEKDKDRVYYKGEEISEANPSTFSIISHGLSKDNRNYYWRTEKIDEDSLKKIVEINNIKL